MPARGQPAGAKAGGRPPNLLLVITDQQRAPQHWPEDPAWLRDLMPADAELARTGLRFTRAFCNTCMCSPSRATLLTGRLPAGHGVTLTHTDTGARPTPLALAGALARGLTSRQGDLPPALGLRSFARVAAALTRPPTRRVEPELRPETPNLATVLGAAGYHVAYKGKWHLTKPLDPRHRWTAADAVRIERDLGFAGWEPPDAGEDTLPEHFGGGDADWDEAYTAQAERFLAQHDLPEPFALVVSLVNPHDVLAYPATWAAGGYGPEAVADLGVPLPPTLDEDLAGKPLAHALLRRGQDAYLGHLGDAAARRAYVSFYAHLHRIVDAKVGRLLAALGDPGDPGSLRARTVIVRCSDHGEMGLAHGGLRQKMFNAYEETIRVPLVISNPVLFPAGAETDALASLADVVPTAAGLAGTAAPPTDGRDLRGALARHARPDRAAAERLPVDLGAVLDAPPADRVADAIPFTYDDDAAGTFLRDTVPPPNHLRAVREPRWKYATYVDPAGRAPPQHELYDLEADPLEVRNLVDRDTGEALAGGHGAELDRLRERVRAIPTTSSP